MGKIKQIKDFANTAHDLDNRSVTITTVSETPAENVLSANDVALLQASNQNYIVYSGKIYRLVSADASTLCYGREDVANSQHELFTITISSGAFTYAATDIVSNTTVEEVTNKTVTSENKIATMDDIQEAIGDAMNESY